jgi:hypothetical protein
LYHSRESPGLYLSSKLQGISAGNLLNNFAVKEDAVLDKSESGAAEKPGESSKKREKFVELAQARTKNAIKAIRIIGKLGNKNAYEFTEADVRKIAAALNREVDSMKARMSSSGSKETVDFTL